MDGGATDPWRLHDALGNDRDAWNGIVSEFAPSIWAWARSRGLTKEEAEDVSQTVWYRLRDRGHTIRDPRTLAGWLAITTKREAQRVAAKRRQRETVSIDDVDPSEDPGHQPEDHVAAADTRSRLHDAYSRLSAACRDLLSLCWRDDLSYQDIAEALDRPIGSIGPSRQRCLGQLRDLAGV